MIERLKELLDILRQEVNPTPEVLEALQEMDEILNRAGGISYGTLQ